MRPKKCLLRLVCISGMVLFTAACTLSSYPTTQPVIQPTMPAPPLEPTATRWIPPAPNATTRPEPSATRRPEPTDTPPPPPTEAPPPSHPDLPPLPDFRGSVITAGIGGGPLCDDRYQGPPKALGAANSFVPARTAYICIYGFNFDRNLHIEITAPDGSITLAGDYFVSSQDFDITWNGLSLRNYGSNANWLGGVEPGEIRIIGEAYTRTYIKTRWRGDLPDGDWHIRVFGDNQELNGTFHAIAPEYPSLTVLDSRPDWIKPAYSNCFLADQPQDLGIIVEGYPPNRDVYVYVYEQNEGLVLQTATGTDALGSFYQAIPGPYHPGGQYFVIGALEPLGSPDAPPGNTVDCFYVP
jgi:hypothetical protein